MMSSDWVWTGNDIVWAYVRYRGEIGGSDRKVVPANFIKQYSKGDSVDNSYQYKIYWSDDPTRTTPIQYLQKTAGPIPEFIPNEPAADYGSPGLYRATVYHIDESLEGIKKWKESGRVKDVPDKLLFTSFDDTLSQMNSITRKGSLHGNKEDANKPRQSTADKKLKVNSHTKKGDKSGGDSHTKKDDKSGGDSGKQDKKHSDEAESKQDKKTNKVDSKQAKMITDEVDSKLDKRKMDIVDSKDKKTEKVDSKQDEKKTNKVDSKQDKKKTDKVDSKQDKKKTDKVDSKQRSGGGRKSKQEDDQEKHTDKSGEKQSTLGNLGNVAKFREKLLKSRELKKDNEQELSDAESAVGQQMDQLEETSDESAKAKEESSASDNESKSSVSSDRSRSVSSCSSSSGDSTSQDGDKSDNSSPPKPGQDRKGRKKLKRGRKASSSSSNSDLEISSPRKVQQLESNNASQLQALKRAAVQRERLQEENLRLRMLLNLPTADFGGERSPSPLPKTENDALSVKTIAAAVVAEVNEKANDKDSGAKRKSKRMLKEEEAVEKRRKITSLFPIPENFSYTPEDFVISATYSISKDQMEALWEFSPGVNGDSLFVKTAAVNVFGSRKLLEVGCVAGNKSKGVKKSEGLDPTALEAIRVLLILRVKREGKEVLWDTRRTKQTTVNTYIGDKIRTLKDALAKKCLKEIAKDGKLPDLGVP